MTSETINTSGSREGRYRRLIPVLGSYLAIGFGLLQFLEMLVGRYGLSDVLIDRFLILWLGALPLAALFGYFGGGLPAGRNGGLGGWHLAAGGWAIALAAATIILPGDGMGRVEQVAVMGANGEKITAVVPKEEAIKSVTVFPFDLDGLPEADAYLRFALPEIMLADLQQHADYYPSSYSNVFAFYEEFGVDRFAPISTAIARKIAQRNYNDYFIVGNVSRQSDDYVLTTEFYRSRDGKKMATVEKTSDDYFTLIDETVDALLKELPRPKGLPKGEEELPVSSLMSNKPAAIRAHFEARITQLMDPSTSYEELQGFFRATELDPTSAEFAYFAANMLYLKGDREGAVEEMERAVQLATALPRRQQYAYKLQLFNLKGDVESIEELSELQRQLFPYDYSPYAMLFRQYRYKKGLDSTVALLEAAIDNGHVARGLLNLVNLYEQFDYFDRAEETLDRYFEAYPDRTDNQKLYVDIYEARNDFDAARAKLRELSTLNPTDMDLSRRLVGLEYRLGELEDPIAAYRELLAKAKTGSDSIKFLNSLQGVYTGLGRIDDAFATLDEAAELQRAYTVESNIIVSQAYSRIRLHVLRDDREAALSVADGVTQQMPQLGSLYSCMTNLLAILDQMPWAEPLEQGDCFETLAQMGSSRTLLSMVTAVEQEDYAAALNVIQNAPEDGVDRMVNDVLLARLYRETGQTDAARERVTAALDRRATNADALVELARLEYEADPQQALAFLSQALEYWSEADEEFVPARRAKTLYDQWTANS